MVVKVRMQNLTTIDPLVWKIIYLITIRTEGRQTNKQTNRQTYRRTDRQTETGDLNGRENSKAYNAVEI
mgnify:CR=1